MNYLFAIKPCPGLLADTCYTETKKCSQYKFSGKSPVERNELLLNKKVKKFFF